MNRLKLLQRVSVALALALLAAACGSTAQVGGDSVRLHSGDLSGEDEMALGEDFGSPDGVDELEGLDGVDGEGFDLDPAGEATGGGGGGGGGEAGSPGAAASGGGGGGGGGTAAAGSGTSARGFRPAAQGAQGIDDRRMHVGLAYADDQTAGNEAIGAEGVTGGDPARYFEALLKHFNGRGGVAGRELVPVYHRYQATSSQSYSQQNQEACTRFTQDNRVFVSLTAGIGGDDNFVACVDKAGIPIITDSRLDDDDTFRKYRRYSAISGLSTDAIGRFWPKGLADGGYFKPRSAVEDVKVGLITYDLPVFRNATERSLKPAMRAIGREFADERYVKWVGAYNEVGQLTAEIGNAILQFRNQGIQHVMIFDSTNALITIMFLRAAESQGYEPRYGLNSNNGGQVMAGLVSHSQLRDSVSVAWNPTFDVPEGAFDDWGPGRLECEKIYGDAGITFSDTNAKGIAMIYCDGFRSLLAAVNATSGPLSEDAVVQGITRLGTSFDAATLGPTRLAPDRRYGLARYRLSAWDPSCSCFKYTSDWRRIP